MPARKGPKPKKATTVKKSAAKKQPRVRRPPAEPTPLERPQGTPGAAPPFGPAA